MPHSSLTNPQLSRLLQYLRRDASMSLGLQGDFVLNNIVESKRPYSVIYQLKLSSGNIEKMIYLKVPRDQAESHKIKKEFDTLAYFYRRYKDHPRLHVVNPLTYYEDPPCLVTDMVEGEVLHNVIRKSARMFPTKDLYLLLIRYCEMSGKWLRLFQQMDIPNGIAEFHLHDETNFILGQIDRCIANNLISTSTGRAVRDYVESVNNTLHGKHITVSNVHSDFIPVNIIIHQDSITVIDFSDFKSGAPYRDAASFLFALDCYRQNPLFVTLKIQSLKKAFLDGLGWNNVEDQAQIFNLFNVREILGHLLQISSRYDRNPIDRLKLFRLKMFSHRQLLEKIYPVV